MNNVYSWIVTWMPSLRCTYGLLSLLDVLHLRAFVLWAYRHCMTRTQWMSNSQHRPARAGLLCLVALCAFAFYSTSHRSRCDLGLLVCSAGLLSWAVLCVFFRMAHGPTVYTHPRRPACAGLLCLVSSCCACSRRG